MCGSGTPAEQADLEPENRIRLSRAPPMKYKYLFRSGARPMGCALEFFRRVAKETGSSLVRAVATEREIICDALRIAYAPYAPSSKGSSSPAIRPEGMANTLGIMRALSRLVKDAARVETPFFRAFDARYSYLMKYNLPLSKGRCRARGPESLCSGGGTATTGGKMG